MTSTLSPGPTPVGTLPHPRPRRRRVALAGGLLAAMVLVATAFAGIAPLLSPATPANAAAAAGFPLDAARDDLAAVAAAPHPMGSAEQATVEAYLVGELTAMGLQPQVDAEQVTMAPDPPNSVWTGTVRNIVARIEGTGPDADQAVLLAAHYDSVPTAAGAGDNGAGVVSVLAAMRMLAAAPPRHDVIAAFVDGEEHEMLGSLALVETAGWMSDVQVVVNTEGVGNAGRVTPALTTPSNGWALRQYLAAAPSPVVYSAFDAPLNATGQGADLGRYQDVVPAGLELVGIGGLPAYHAGTDTADGIHEGTLAEYGATVVQLAQRLSEADLGSVQAPNLVAFTVVDGVTVAYPSTWSLPLAVLAAAGVVATTWLALRRGRVRTRRVVLAWLALGVAGLSGILAATGLWVAARAVDPRLSDALNGGVYERTPYVLAALAAGAAGVLLVLWPLRRRCTGLEAVAGALVGWSLVALLLAVFLPDAAYAATWPLLAATVGFGVLAARERPPGVTLVTVTLATIPAFLLVSPLIGLYFLLAARFELMIPVATPLPMLWAVLALTLVIPLLLLARPRPGWRPAAAAAAVAVSLAAVGVAVGAASSGPRPDLLVYHADGDAGTARWVALPQRVDAYTSQVADGGWTPTTFEASPFHQPGDTEPASSVPAPVLPAVDPLAPQLAVSSDITTSQGREIALDVSAASGTYALTLDVRSGAGVSSITVNGAPVPEATSGDPASVRVVAYSPTGNIPVEVSVPTGADVEVAMASYTRGLDGTPAPGLQPRPPNLTTAVHEVPDAVLVTKIVRLPG